MPRKSIISAVMSAVVLLVMLPAPAVEPPLFSNLEGFATKTGFRGVFAWQAAQPVKAVVHYGTSPTALNSTLENVPGVPDEASVAILDGLTIGATYYWQVEDLITGKKSEVSSFEAKNAYNDWDGSTYTLDLLVQLDSESLPKEVPFDMAVENAAQGINVFAERLYDATDGFARLGNVIVMDTEVDYAGSIQGADAPECTGVEGAGGNLADVLIQTAVPFDSHTFHGWAIDEPCTSFYVGRLGQLIVPWGQVEEEDLHFGYVATHEMLHYAFNAPDLYNLADINAPRTGGCWNLDWDGSLMHNDGGWNGTRWEFTELDRNPSLTPCEHDDDPEYSWDALRERYTEVPLRPTGPIEHIVDTVARGNEDGGALDIKVLNRTGPKSTFTSFTPDDTNAAEAETLTCTPDGPVVADGEGDATAVANATGVGPNEAALDVREGRLAWNSTSEELTFAIKVTDIEAANPESAPNIDYVFEFDYDGGTYYVEAFRSAAETRFSFGELVASPRLQLATLSGSIDTATETITITLPKSVLAAAGVKTFELDDELTNLEVFSRRGYTSSDITSAGAIADRTDPGCPYTIGRGAVPKPATVEPDGYLTLSSPRYDWEGDILVDALAPFTGFNAPSQCNGTANSPGCEKQLVHVSAEASGTPLKFVIETDNPNSFITNVYGPDGQLWASLDSLGSPKATVEGTATLTGIYTVVIRPWAAANAHYEAYGFLGTEPPPGIDATLSGSNTSYAWDGVARTEAGAAFGCDGISDYACETTRIEVLPQSGGNQVTITALADNPEVTDIDLYVYDSNGVVVKDSATEGGDEALNFRVDSPGVYDVVIKSYLAVEAGYHAVATLNPPLPPPSSEEFDGEISSGGSYSWSGMLTPNPALYCQGNGQTLCHNELVKVNVPDGGGLLTIVFTPDEDIDPLGCNVHVYDPDGTRIAEANFTDGVITLKKAVTKSGVYRIGLASSTTLTSYSATASLS